PVVPGGQDVRQHRQVEDLLHRLVAVGEDEAVPVRVRDQDVLRLPADPAAHVDVAVGAARPVGVDVETDLRAPRLAVPAATAGDVERDGDEVALLDELDVRPGLDDLTGDLVAQHEVGRRGGAAPDHVLVRAADVGGDGLEDDAVRHLPSDVRRVDARAVLQLEGGVVGLDDLDLARALVRNCSVACHALPSPRSGRIQGRSPGGACENGAAAVQHTCVPWMLLDCDPGHWWFGVRDPEVLRGRAGCRVRRQPAPTRSTRPSSSSRPIPLRTSCSLSPAVRASPRSVAVARTGRASRTRAPTGSRPSSSPGWTGRSAGRSWPLGARSSSTSAASVTHTASVSRSSRWQPADAIEVTGPGTAPTGRSRSAAWWAVLSAPERQPASTTTQTCPSAAMSRLRRRNRCRWGEEPGAGSARTTPSAMTASRSALLPLG